MSKSRNFPFSSLDTTENPKIAQNGFKSMTEECSPDRSGACIVVSHPWTSVKAQSPANYARVLSQGGFICLTFDAAYQGESEGEPRNLEAPYQRVEDIKSAVIFLTGCKEVNPEKIEVLGICASGGYAPFTTQTDLRIKACATVAAVSVGTMARRGFERDTSNMSILQGQLDGTAKDRNSEIGGEKVPIVHLLPEKIEDVSADLPEPFKDLANYYRTPTLVSPGAGTSWPPLTPLHSTKLLHLDRS